MAGTPSSDGVTAGVASISFGETPPPPPGGTTAADLPPAPLFGNNPGAAPFSFNLGTGAAAAGEDDDDDDDDDDEEGDEMDGAPLPIDVLKRVLGLKALHEKRAEKLKEYMVERCQLEAKYRALMSPIYRERATVITGGLEPVLGAEDAAQLALAAKAEKTRGGDEEPMVGIPDFWLSALGRHGAFEHFLEEPDVDALKNLTDVRSIDHDDMTGFTLEFEFSENNYFKNTVLTKKYTIPNLAEANGEPELASIEGCQIDWVTPTDCLVRKEIKKKQKAKRGKNAGQTRFVTKVEPKQSFFTFFDTIKIPGGGGDDDEDDDEDDEDDDEDDALRDKIDMDVELAFALRNQIVPNAVLWFTGDAVDDDDESGDEEDFDNDDDDDDDEEDD